MMASLGAACRSAGGPGHPASTGTLAATVDVGGVATRVQDRLPNGMVLVVEENHAAPAVALQLWLGRGAADDPPGLGGAAHLSEHLLLRGSARRAAGAAARELEELGGSIGAWTGPDETVFHAAVASPFWELALATLAEPVTAPRLEREDIETARKAIADETATSAADPARVASGALFASVAAGGPSLRPPFAADLEIATAPREKIATWFSQTYVGAALTLVVVGDVQARAVRAAAERAFAVVPARAPQPGAVASRAARDQAGRIVFSRAAVAAPEVALGFRAPRLTADDAARLDLLAALLVRHSGRGAGPSAAGPARSPARVERDVVRDRALASSARAFTICSRQGGLLVLAVVPAPRRLEEAVRATLEAALSVAREPPSAAELGEARAALEADVAESEAGLEGHARRLGFSVAIAEDVGYAARYRERLHELGLADLQAAAGRLFGSGAVALSIVLPAGPPAGRDETEAALRPRLATLLAEIAQRETARASPVAAAVRAERGDLVRFALPGGPRVVVLRDTSALSIDVEAVWPGGAASESAAESGRGALIAALLLEGTRARSPADLAAELAATGARLDPIAGPSAVGLRAQLLPDGLERGLAVLADCILHPRFGEVELEARRRALLERVRTDEAAPDAPARAALRAFSEVLWPKQPYHLDLRPSATREGIAGMTGVRLLDHYRRRYPLSRLVVSVVGDVDPGRVAGALAPLFATGQGESAPPSPEAALADAPAGGTVFRAWPGAEEAYVVVGYPGLPPEDPDGYALEVLAEVLAPHVAAPTGSALLARLAGEQSLVRSLEVRAASGGEPGYFAVCFAASPVRLDETVGAVRAALARVGSEDVPAEELARAAQRVIGRGAGGLGSQAAVAEAIALDEVHNLDPLNYRERPSLLSRVGTADVLRAARRVLDPKREVIAVVRPPSAVANTERGR